MCHEDTKKQLALISYVDRIRKLTNFFIRGLEKKKMFSLEKKSPFNSNIFIDSSSR